LQIILLDRPFELIAAVELLNDAVPTSRAFGSHPDMERDVAFELDERELAKR